MAAAPVPASLAAWLLGLSALCGPGCGSSARARPPTVVVLTATPVAPSAAASAGRADSRADECAGPLVVHPVFATRVPDAKAKDGWRVAVLLLETIVPPERDDFALSLHPDEQPIRTISRDEAFHHGGLRALGTVWLFDTDGPPSAMKPASTMVVRGGDGLRYTSILTELVSAAGPVSLPEVWHPADSVFSTPAELRPALVEANQPEAWSWQAGLDADEREILAGLPSPELRKSFPVAHATDLAPVCTAPSCEQRMRLRGAILPSGARILELNLAHARSSPQSTDECTWDSESYYGFFLQPAAGQPPVPLPDVPGYYGALSCGGKERALVTGVNDSLSVHRIEGGAVRRVQESNWRFVHDEDRFRPLSVLMDLTACSP